MIRKKISKTTVAHLCISSFTIHIQGELKDSQTSFTDFLQLDIIYVR
jgi:hypothetical protein